MADKSGSFRTNRVSRHTMVIRKAKEDDAKRLEEKPDSLTQSIQRDGEAAPRAPEPPKKTSDVRERSESTRYHRRVSGRTVMIQRESGAASRVVMSDRISGRPASVRVVGGDTIIRYKSGDLVVKRADRRTLWRKRVIISYVCCYLAVFAVYAYYLFTGTMTMEPSDYVERAFAKRHGDKIADLEWASMEAMRGNRTPAEVRFAEALVFHDENNATVRVEAGDRLTLLTAAKLGQAIIKDLGRDAEKREFNKPLKLYRETYLTNMNWPFWLALMNAAGFFLLMGLFLWRPGRSYLGTQGKKTAVALREARAAMERSEEIRTGFTELMMDISARGETLRESIQRQGEESAKAVLVDARKKAVDLERETRDILKQGKAEEAVRLGRETAAEACRLAEAILKERLGRTEHDLAMDELIAGVSSMQLQ